MLQIFAVFGTGWWKLVMVVETVAGEDEDVSVPIRRALAGICAESPLSLSLSLYPLVPGRSATILDTTDGLQPYILLPRMLRLTVASGGCFGPERAHREIFKPL